MGRKYVNIEDHIPFDLDIQDTEFGHELLGNITKKSANFNFRCCDCHLVHNIALIPEKGKIKVVMQRDNRATSQLRNHREIHITRKNGVSI